jgi:hypothetical protein
MTAAQPDRLDRLERVVDSLITITAQVNQQATIERHQEALGRLISLMVSLAYKLKWGSCLKSSLKPEKKPDSLSEPSIICSVEMVRGVTHDRSTAR